MSDNGQLQYYRPGLNGVTGISVFMPVILSATGIFSTGLFLVHTNIFLIITFQVYYMISFMGRSTCTEFIVETPLFIIIIVKLNSRFSCPGNVILQIKLE